MKPAEEIGIDELNESGIVHVGLEFCPTIGFDEMGEPFLSGTSAFHFIDRYNNKKFPFYSVPGTKASAEYKRVRNVLNPGKIARKMSVTKAVYAYRLHQHLSQ